MTLISSCANLTNCYNENNIRLVKENEEKKMERNISCKLDKCYETFEEFQKAIFIKIDQAFKDIQDKKYCIMDEALEELEKKYGLSRT